MSYHFFVNKWESNVSGWSWWWKIDSIFIICMLNVSNAGCMWAWIFCGVLRPRSNYCFLLLLFFFPLLKTACIVKRQNCASTGQGDVVWIKSTRKNSFICLWFFFSTWLLYGCVLNVHSFNGTYLQLWYLKMYKGYIVYIDLLKFHCHGWLTLVAMESSIIHHHLGRNKNISICVKIEQKHNKVCTLFYS